MHRKARALGVLLVAGFTLSACGGATGDNGGSESGGADTPQSQSYPADCDSIRLIVPYGAGGGTDLGARLLGGALEEELGTSFVVENIPTASGQEALRTLTESAPDGCTLSFTPLPATNMQYLDEGRGATFDGDDFAAIGTHDTDPIGVAVSADSEWQTIDDLIEFAKATPGEVTAGSSGVLAAGHLGFIQFEEATGVDMTWANFEDSGQLRSSVIGENVTLETNTMTEMIPAHINGDLRILASLSEEAPEDLEGVQSIVAAGYDEAVMATNRVLVAPAGTPEDVLNTLSSAMESVMMTEEYQQEADSLQLSLNYMDAEATQTLWNQLDERFGPIAEEFRAENG